MIKVDQNDQIEVPKRKQCKFKNLKVSNNSNSFLVQRNVLSSRKKT